MSDRERVEALAPMLADEMRMYGHAHGSWLPLDLARHLAKQLADSPAMRDLLAEAKADALREARAELGNALDGFVASELSYGNHNRAAALRSLAAWNDGAGYRIDREVKR